MRRETLVGELLKLPEVEIRAIRDWSARRS
jgi:hypothetical protein